MMVWQPRSDAEATYASLAVEVISEARTGTYIAVALASGLIYHSFITLEKEVKYIWSNPRSLVSFIYFVNRYVGVLGAVSVITIYSNKGYSSCRFAFWMGSLANMITVILIDYVLQMRVLALYSQDKRLSIFLKAFLGVEAGVDLGILLYGNIFEDFDVVILGTLEFCGSRNNPTRSLNIISWVIPLAYGLILLGLALYKAAEYWKLSSGFKGFHLIRVLIMDQIIYYGFVIFCCVVKVADNAIFSINPFASRLLNIAGSPTLLCVLGGQLLINLKEAGERGANGGVSYTPNTISGIEFS